MNLSLKQLRVFVAVSQQQSITHAAKSLFLTKAAVSMALSELENQLDQQLFDRTNNRLHLNPYGQRLLPIADELLHRAASIDTLFQQSGQLIGDLAIGASETIGNQICPWLIAQFRQQTEHTQQTLHIRNSEKIAEMILSYQLDIGLIEGDVRHNDIETTPWLKDEMCIIVAANHPLLKKSALQLTDLADNTWVLREPGSGSRAFFDNNIVSEIQQWQLAYQLNSIEAQLNFVAAGLGLACVSKFSATHALANNRVQILPLDTKLERQYKIIMHKQKFKSELITAFIEFSQQWDSSQLIGK
ncbi:MULTISPECIES: LysR substrate-binding domain-containing protein [unclassified Moritella]|uniref:LysR substrate-binding domain-containing protein n=1 Tax=unclassified Moritella TaxID=2637987 RepID=UPI001BA7D533|nr:MULTISPECIES: LysR substrate-binding domain-containing protein [unclassified Moritella]QUM85929.1 LysR family transcriptional regulator [Moritella sp. 28]QUM90160.1 LysR family transcriptional regulator [Moritella sp. 36]